MLMSFSLEFPRPRQVNLNTREFKAITHRYFLSHILLAVRTVELSH